MLRIAVCDDEQSYLHDVERLLDEYGAAHGMHYAIHGNTAAEVIVSRADYRKEHMKISKKLMRPYIDHR